MSARVVVTGVGAVTPLGRDVTGLWSNILSARNSFGEVQSFPTNEYPNHVGSEVKNYKLPSCISRAETKVYGRATIFAVDAVSQALADSGLIEINDEMRARFGVIMGTTFGEAQIVEGATLRYAESKANLKSISQYSPVSLSVNIAKKFKLSGPNLVIPTACAAGNYAIAYGTFLIKSGITDLMVAGGSDPFSHVSFSGFSRLGVMAEQRCQPFDRDRKGMIVGEGAGSLVLERYDIAKSRGAKIYAEILGCGLTSDASHMTIPDVAGVMSMMQKAMNDAGLSVKDIDYICAHGTGTVVNDKTESKAVSKLFYEKGVSVPISSIKSMIGHTMGAASAIESVICALAIKNGMIPPTANFNTKDPECDVDCVPNEPRPERIKYLLNNALAFGGNNASLLMADV